MQICFWQICFLLAPKGVLSYKPFIRPTEASPPTRAAPLPIVTFRQIDRTALQQQVVQPNDSSRATVAPEVVRARAMLLGAGAVWGTYPVVLRALYAAPGPTLPPLFIVTVRFQLTSLLFAAANSGGKFMASRAQGHRQFAYGGSLPFPPRQRTAAVRCSFEKCEGVPSRQLRRAGAELACVGLVGNFLSVWGLSKVAATLAETLLGCVHIFVPLLTVAMSGWCAVGLRTWQACALSFLAVCVAASGSSGVVLGVSGASHYLGLAALVGAAGLYSLARVRTSLHVGVRRIDPQALNRQRMGSMGGLATAALVTDAVVHAGPSRAILSSLFLITPMQWSLILVSCVASGFLGSSLQFQAQKVVPAASSQPFFALQPLFACGWTWLFLAEPIAPSMLTSGAMMVGGALLASMDANRVEEDA